MHHALVSVCAMEAIDKRPETRRKTGELLYELLINQVISMDAYIKGMAELLEMAEDMLVDIPKFYVYVRELVEPQKSILKNTNAPLAVMNRLFG